jgi:hypothetical protein
MIFSKDLIDRTIKYFAEVHNHHIDEETVELYLNSLADLFDSYRRMLQEKANRDRDRGEGPSVQ